MTAHQNNASLERALPPGHTRITRCRLNPHRLPGFVEGSPYVFSSDVELFRRSLRDDISLMTVQPAQKSFRQVSSEPYPLPETCAPYVDANSLGFYLRPVLPIVLVRTRAGEPLSEARVALKYLRENSRRFSSTLQLVEHHARQIFRPDAYDRLRRQRPVLVADVVQPYSMFTRGHLSLRTGLWIYTPAGTSTLIGPPINQLGPLRILMGSVETDWHHLELFVVAEYPEFSDQVLVIEPTRVLAQIYFVDRRVRETTEVRFSDSDPGGDPMYRARWEALERRLDSEGLGTSVSRSGVASVRISCPHCYASVTEAAETPLQDGHQVKNGFHPAYKLLQRQSRRLAKEKSDGGQ
jgi:hypothetical protein